MMDKIKLELGQKIQHLREEKGISRQNLCQLEEELTVRQLQRIEKGQSLPSIATALYIADQLGVSLETLVDRESLSLPKGYLDLKQRYLATPYLGDPGRLLERERILDELHETYYEKLPEEEQLLLQIFQAILDMVTTRNGEYDQGLVDEYLERALKKRQLTMVELSVFDLTMTKMMLTEFDAHLGDKISEKALQAVDYLGFEDLKKLRKSLTTYAGMFCHLGDYKKIPEYIQVLEKILQVTKNFNERSYIYRLEYKVALFLEHDLEKAEKYYQMALQLVELLDDQVQRQGVLHEWEEDMEKYQAMNN